MVSKKVTLTNKTGLHARPASNLVAFVKKYKSERKDNKYKIPGNIKNIVTG